MTTKTTLAGLLAICIFAHADEIVIASFDGEKETVQRMSEIIRRAAVEGSTLVRFPDGQWKWHDLTRLGLPPKSDLARKEYEIGEPEMEKHVREWIAKHNVKAVLIAINKEAPANVFFKIERLLTRLNIPYALVSDAEVVRGKLLLLDTNGVVRLAKVEQLLPVLGQDFLKPIVKQTTPMKACDWMTCTIKNVKATGRPSENGFLVLKGSEAVLKERPSVKNYPYPSTLRSQLLSEGTLTTKTDRLVFVKDYEFSSPSAAASVIHGGHANGLISWKNPKGVTIKELEQKDVANKAIDSDEE